MVKLFVNIKNYYNIILNEVKKRTYGVVSHIGKIDRIGFSDIDSREDWYVDRVLYRFGKPIQTRRYFDLEELNKDKKFSKSRIIVKGFLKNENYETKKN